MFVIMIFNLSCLLGQLIVCIRIWDLYFGNPGIEYCILLKEKIRLGI